MRKKLITIILLLLGISISLQAQRNLGLPNLLKYDKQRFHFGFMIGYNQYDFTMKTKGNLNEYDSLMRIYTSSLSGFNLGIVANLRLGEYFDLRFIPGLTFADRMLNYSIKYNNNQEFISYKNVESVFLDFPLLVKFKSSRMHNVRAYVVGGVQYSRDLISNAKKQAANPREIYVKVYPDDFQVQTGVGFDFYLTYFKFSTELKMSFGVPNILVPEPHIYSTSVTGLKTKVIQISFLFE
jgi:hypothetical protein